MTPLFLLFLVCVQGVQIKNVGENISSEMSSCEGRPESHICDPGHTLAAATYERQSASLRQLTNHMQICTGLSFEVYVALLNEPADTLRATAVRLGKNWRILDSPCKNGLIAVYSTRDKLMALVADPTVEKLLTQHIGRLEWSEPDEVIPTIISNLSLGLIGFDADASKVGREAALVVLCIIVLGLFVSLSILVSCGIYDMAARWRHLANFHACHKKLRRVHEELVNVNHDLTLCPYCVNDVQSQPSPTVVVFLCGHRFHMQCANRWFLEKPEATGKCPICAGFGTCDKEMSPSADAAKTFILKSLRKQYPGIISKDQVEHWASCHTETWLTELTRPRFKSIFYRK